MGQIYQFKAIDNIFAIIDIPEDVVKIIYKYYMTMMRNKNLIKCNSDTFDMLYEHRVLYKSYGRSEPIFQYCLYSDNRQYISNNTKILLKGLHKYQELKNTISPKFKNSIRTFTCHMCMRERFVSCDAVTPDHACEGDNCYYNNDYHNYMPLICDSCMEYEYHEDNEDINITYCNDRCIRGNPELEGRLDLIENGDKCYMCNDICLDCEQTGPAGGICCNNDCEINLCSECVGQFINCYECHIYIEVNSSCGEEIKGIDYCCECLKGQQSSDSSSDSTSDSSDSEECDSDDSVISGC